MIKFKKALVPAIAALFAGAIAVAAANITLFSSIGDVIFPFSAPLRDGSAGTIDNMKLGATTPREVHGTTGDFSSTVTAPQVNAALGTFAANPTPSDAKPTYVFADNQTQMLFTPSGTVSYAYITLPPNPKNNQQACVFSTTAITTVYLSPNAGQSLLNAITTLGANTQVCYTYGLSNTTWYRSK